MFLQLSELKKMFSGDIFTDKIHRTIYSTDASAYKEEPIAVAFPKSDNDIKELIKFASENKTSLIPRGAGTSLAGQVTGKGIVVDVSKHFNKIIAVDTDKKTVTVQPGVVLSELNVYLSKLGLFFGPETSTANRCTMGGMSGNNACGLHSLIYGSTRDHTASIKALLTDGSEVVFNDLTKEEFEAKCKLNNFEGELYRHIYKVLSDTETQNIILKEYPDKEVKRRNTGYALDMLLKNDIFNINSEEKFNFCKLLSGSEGTLVFITEITLKLLPLPPKNKAIITVEFEKLEHSFYANLIALKYKPGAVELTDKTILDLTKDNPGFKQNRFFIEGDPEAILIIEFARETFEEIEEIARLMEAEMRQAGLGYSFKTITGKNITKVWDLRKAGLGILSNMPGDGAPVSLVEDTAINVEKLPEYIKDFQKILAKYRLNCVYHAHIGTGELHLRPILNLKSKADVEIFRNVAHETALLVKSYGGSLSGEHGDGRLRGEFIPLMYGNRIYNIFKDIKSVWDPTGIFNPGKITDTPPMNEYLRYIPGNATKEYSTTFDFSKTLGYLRAAEKCNGSGDCRKSEISGGTLCPSYMASRNEKNTTRARANMLREVLTNSDRPFEDENLYEVLDLCLSCKACKSECPSNVDVAKLKAEFLQHRYDIKGIPMRSRLVAEISKINGILSLAPALSNFFLNNKFFSKLIMNTVGFNSKRKMPAISTKTLLKHDKSRRRITSAQKTVYLFADEFTNYNEADIGITTILLLEKLGYNVIIPKHTVSGRTYISKGLIRKAKVIAKKNIDLLKNIISEDKPLIGIEPSAILTFRDEYIEFFNAETEKIYHTEAKNLSKNVYTLDEFLAKEMKSGYIKKESFKTDTRKIKLHGHCQQKSIASTEALKYILSFPENYSVEEIPSGCCGMAGSFGYEKEHYELSMKIGELVLFPAVRNAEPETIIAASGTSCRCQIADGTGVKALHPAETLFRDLRREI